MTRQTLRSAAAGSTVTSVLLLSPFPYAYAPLVGGIVAGYLESSKQTPRSGLRAGALVGLCMFGWAIVLLALADGTTLVSQEAGVTAIVQGMEGAGPRSIVFYATFAWLLAVYSGLAATMSGSITGFVANRLR